MARIRTTRAQRRALRAQVGPLQQTLLKAKTRTLYDFSLSLFALWRVAMGLSFPACASDLDDMVMLFITTAWEEGETRAVADNLISGLKDADPDLLGQRLKGSARLMRA